MDGRDAGFTGGQFIGALRTECGKDDTLVLHGFRVIERRVAEGFLVAPFNANDFYGAIGGGEFELPGGQRRAAGIDKDIHRAEANGAFLGTLLLREQGRRRPKEQNHKDPRFQHCYSTVTKPAAAKVAEDSRTPRPRGESRA